MTTDMSRRRLFALGGGALGAAAAGSFLPPSLQAAIAAQPAHAGSGGGGLGSIKHVVILMQENRSFDHYFGTLRGVRGFGDRNAIELPTGGTVFEQPAAAGSTVLPFPVRGAAEEQKKDLQYIGALDHSWNGGAKAWGGGWMNGWISAKTAATMAYYDRRDIPLHYELADTFTVCDAYHSSIHTSTSPNRNHLWSGKTGFEPNGKRAVGNDAYNEGTHPGYDWSTYAERLEKAGRSWRTYTEWENFTDNQIEFYATFKAIARKALARTGGHTYMEAFYAKVRGASETERTRLLGLLEEGVATLDRRERSLFERGLRRVPTGTLADEFAKDVAAGTLPAVSYLVPSAIDSEHPSTSSPVHSATIVYKILDALGKHPDVWRHTAVLINYDENDGFFDHVPPPVAPPEVADEQWEGRPTGLGIRVPLLVVSPWTVGGYVCSEVFDHTSVIRFLERWTGVREPNISDWRRRVTGDLTSAFDFTRARRQPAVQTPGAIPPFEGRWQPKPPAVQQLPAQEPGARPARPLPYRPDARARRSGDTLRVELANAGRSSAHFALYPYAGEFPAPQHKDVRDTAHWTVPLTGEAYRFTVTGPNGFRREFAGPVDGGAEVATRIDHRDRDLHLTLRNSGRRALTFLVRPLGYVDEDDVRDWTRRVTVKPGRSRALVHSAADAHGWYDLAVTVDGEDGFRRRLMGHIENGRASVSG
ncbi:phospholipase C, phosphocholine-specific [Streptomyces anulatus]|uniref:phosphocholine-specific phospholipase C n=1 Tax=Streptomyces anulatus TaxID=1892 RepID=UPI002257274E|nr:phospholipase C, phosphocholine-specific [Streptomyces anulatus]MCX4488362.1 phospholipase C, phosphocholine-specific [Streptomyces anulatus]MCX4521438.1 phospholipase C, phosphocholine-specific [Streptomyces anulatus]WSI80561.1 phospholipase C, phosphocholine-specific [Streptomyces anulatus]WTD12898.1 phospholipase C, phosphocholine-specific [Streptomyces anulatus]WTE06208.1 phospholipase C, phosphocholine-specific [Streptomyces anulatus]